MKIQLFGWLFIIAIATWFVGAIVLLGQTCKTNELCKTSPNSAECTKAKQFGLHPLSGPGIR